MKILVSAQICIGIQQDSAGGLTVAPGPTDFLVIALNAARQGGMNHGADVGLVDAHAKGDGGDDHLQAASAEQVLHPLSFLWVQTGVIGGGRVIHAQFQRQRLGLFASGGINNGGSLSRIGQNPAYRLMPLWSTPTLNCFYRQIGSAKTVNIAGRLGKTELGDDVFLHQQRRSRSQGNHRRGPQQGQMPTQHPVIGAEIMAPLRDAMRFVHCNQHRLALGQHFRETRHAQPLRGDEQIVEMALQILDADLPGSRPIPPGMNPLGPQPQFAELGDLIFHQRDQRRNNQRGSSAGQTGQLKAQRLARSGRHHQQHILALSDGAANLLLIGPKRRQPKFVLQQFQQSIRRSSLPARAGFDDRRRK